MTVELSERIARAASRYAGWGPPLWQFRQWGHAKGSVLVSHDLKTACLNIPKCGSTSLKNILYCHGFEYLDGGNFHLPEDYRAFTVLREPVDRYVSALLQFFQTEYISPIPLVDCPEPLAQWTATQLSDLLEQNRPTVFDAHSIPQACFFDGRIPLNRVLSLVSMNDQVPTLLRDWCRIDVGALPWDNSSTLRSVVEDQLTEEHCSVLTDFYDLDAAMYAGVLDGSFVSWNAYV